jgi:hypothetical protein
MKKPFAALWGLILLISLGGIILLMVTPKGSSEPPATSTPLPTNPPQALIFPPTRFLPTVAIPPTATIPIPPSPYPTMTAFAVTLAAPGPRVFQAGDIANSQSMLVNFCKGFGIPVAVRIFDWSNGSTISFSDQAIAQIPLSWDASNSIFLGYQSENIFSEPSDGQQRWKIDLFLPDGSERWVTIDTSPQTPDTYYVYSFEKIVPFSDKRGEHYGIHPCRAFSIPAEAVVNFLNVVNQYQDIVRYPGFVNGNDPRWTLGTIRPLNASVELRSLPTTKYNTPITTIDQPSKVWLAVDLDWNGWGQVKLGAVQGWVALAQIIFTVDQ